MTVADLPTTNPSSPSALRFTVWCCLALVAFIAYHGLLVWLMRSQGLVLGAFGAGKSVTRIVPIYMHWEFHLKTGLLAALAVLVGFLFWFARRGWSGVDGGRLVAALVGFHLLIAVGVALVDGGPQRLVRSSEQLRATDYYGAVPRVKSVPEFLATYPQLMPDLPMHCQTHPPGGVLFLWLVAQLFGAGGTAAVLAIIGTSSLSVPAVYLLSRETLAEQSARVATALFILAPSIVLFSATCLDAVFMVPMIWALYFLWKIRDRRAIVWGILAGAAATLASLMTYSASFLLIWSLFVAGLSAAVDRSRLKNALLGLLAAAMTAAALYGCLWIVSGYDPWATFTTALHAHGRIMTGGNHATVRQHAHLAVANLVAFLVCAGIPLAVLTGRRVMAICRGLAPRDHGWIFDVSFFGAIAIIDLAPLYTLEVEHIWLFMVPGLAIASARSIRESHRSSPPRLAVAALVLQAVQTVLMEVCFNTVW